MRFLKEIVFLEKLKYFCLLIYILNLESKLLYIYFLRQKISFFTLTQKRKKAQCLALRLCVRLIFKKNLL